MDYWEAVLYELENKDDPNTVFRFTNLGGVDVGLEDNNAKEQRRPNSNKARENKVYLQSEDLRGIYFTPREAETMRLLLQGHTIVSAAREMNLSARTIEFYVKNMKIKVSCGTKAELVEIVKATPFK